MAFDLHITFAGLCLFVDRPGKGELDVLLPPTTGHGSGVEEHVASLGYETRFEETRTTPAKFRDFDLKSGMLDLRSLPTAHPGLHVVLRDVVDITPYVHSAANPAVSEGRVVLDRGTACPTSVCKHFRGGRWRIRTVEQYMSTRVNWLISDVTTQVNGEDGLLLTIVDPQTNQVRQTLPVLRPDDTGVINLYVYHSLQDELPSSCGDYGGSNPKPGDKAEHFHAYYDLFQQHDGAIPIFVNEDRLLRAAAAAFAAGRLGCVVAKVQE